MSKNNAVSVYPSEATRSRLEDYQKQHQLSKSDAAERLINQGFEDEHQGINDVIYWEMAKLCAAVGLTVLFLYTSSSELTYPLYFYGLTLIAAAFVFIVVDRYGGSIRALVGIGADEEPSGNPRGG